MSEKYLIGIRGLHSHDDESMYSIGKLFNFDIDHVKIFNHNEYTNIKTFYKKYPGSYFLGYSAGAATSAIIIKQLIDEDFVPLPERADLYAPYGPSIAHFQNLPSQVNIWPDASSGKISPTGEGVFIKGSHFEIPKKLLAILRETKENNNTIGENYSV